MNKADLLKSNFYYSLGEIHRLHLFEWISTYDALKRLIKEDIEFNKNANFKVVISGRNNGLRYHIKGSNLIKLLKKIEDGYVFK